MNIEDKSDTIAQGDVNAIKGNTSYGCRGEGHFIKDCPLNKDIPSQNQRKPYTPYNNRSTSNTTDIIVPIAQNPEYSLRLIKTIEHFKTQLHTIPPLTTKAITMTKTNIDITTTTENGHSKGHHNRHNNRSMVNEIEDCSECSSDCTDITDFEEPVNTENTDDTKN